MSLPQPSQTRKPCRSRSSGSCQTQCLFHKPWLVGRFGTTCAYRPAGTVADVTSGKDDRLLLANAERWRERMLQSCNARLLRQSTLCRSRAHPSSSDSSAWLRITFVLTSGYRAAPGIVVPSRCSRRHRLALFCFLARRCPARLAAVAPCVCGCAKRPTLRNSEQSQKSQSASCI